MIAVLFVMSSSVPWSAFWIMLAVLAMGIGPLVGWRKPLPASVKRIGVALLIAVALSSTLYATICAACAGCDPWWLEVFWICWPAA